MEISKGMEDFPYARKKEFRIDIPESSPEYKRCETNASRDLVVPLAFRLPPFVGVTLLQGAPFIRAKISSRQNYRVIESIICCTGIHHQTVNLVMHPKEKRIQSRNESLHRKQGKSHNILLKFRNWISAEWTSRNWLNSILWTRSTLQDKPGQSSTLVRVASQFLSQFLWNRIFSSEIQPAKIPFPKENTQVSSRSWFWAHYIGMFAILQESSKQWWLFSFLL